MPELGVSLPSNAVGRDFRDGFYAGLTDSGTGIEINLWGYAGVKIGWVEGVEVNLLGLVAGLDIRQPAHQAAGLRAHRLRPGGRNRARPLAQSGSAAKPATISSAATTRSGRSGSFRHDDRDDGAEQHAGFAQRRDHRNRRHCHGPDRDAVGQHLQAAAGKAAQPVTRSAPCTAPRSRHSAHNRSSPARCR